MLKASEAFSLQGCHLVGTQLETIPALYKLQVSSLATPVAWAEHLVIQGKQNQIPALKWP